MERTAEPLPWRKKWNPSNSPGCRFIAFSLDLCGALWGEEVRPWSSKGDGSISSPEVFDIEIPKSFKALVLGWRENDSRIERIQNYSYIPRRPKHPQGIHILLK